MRFIASKFCFPLLLSQIAGWHNKIQMKAIKLKYRNVTIQKGYKQVKFLVQCTFTFEHLDNKITRYDGRVSHAIFLNFHDFDVISSCKYGLCQIGARSSVTAYANRTSYIIDRLHCFFKIVIARSDKPIIKYLQFCFFFVRCSFVAIFLALSIIK